MLTALTSAVFMIIEIEVIYQFAPISEQTRFGPLRIVEAVTSGFAFLATDTIIYSKGNVQGLSTGASMWLACAIGVACGAGFLSIALASTLFAVIILIPLRVLERKTPKRIRKSPGTKRPKR